MIMSQHGSVSVSVTVDNIIEFATDSFLKSAADSFRRGPEGRLQTSAQPGWDGNHDDSERRGRGTLASMQGRQ